MTVFRKKMNSMITDGMADLGFPRGGGYQLQRVEVTYYLANFSQKMHENEEILDRKRKEKSKKEKWQCSQNLGLNPTYVSVQN